MAARKQVAEAEAALADLDDLTEARAAIEADRQVVEGARILMISRRSAHDELRREGEARLKRSQQVTKEISGWRHRLDTAEKRIAELGDLKTTAEAELKDASAAPEELAAKRDELAGAIRDAEARLAEANDVLSKAEAAQREAALAEREAERLAGEAREARARSEARADAARETVLAAADRIAEELELSPAQLLEQLDVDPDKMPDSAARLAFLGTRTRLSTS